MKIYGSHTINRQEIFSESGFYNEKFTSRAVMNNCPLPGYYQALAVELFLLLEPPLAVSGHASRMGLAT